MNDFNQCEITGFPPYKKIELFTKWRKPLPVEHQDVISPRPKKKRENIIYLSIERGKNGEKIK